MISSAYKIIAVQLAPILHPILSLFTRITNSSINTLNKKGDTPVFELYYTEKQVSFLLHVGNVIHMYLSSQKVLRNIISVIVYAIIITYPKCDLICNNSEEMLKVDINSIKYFIYRIIKNTSDKNMRVLHFDCQIKDGS